MVRRFFWLWALSGLACGPDPVILVDTGQSYSTDTGSLDTADEDSTYFVPVMWQVQEVMFRWQDGRFNDFYLESGGSPVSSTMTIRFLTQEFLETGSSNERCDWTTELKLREENSRDDPDLWVGMQLEPVTQNTDCTDFDPEEWEGGDPREHMETTSLWFGVGPMQALSGVLESLYDSAGQSWATDGEPYAFSLYFGLWSEENWGLWSTEVNYAIAYAVNADGVIQYDSDGAAELVEVNEGMPNGVVRALPYHSHTMDQLPP